ncbi:MAG TPA: thiamine pyrophosphate-requiring protein [Ramlibacter sp.]|uniref:thiamine pyrophosphate-requiring protein n=1 Tax=Ramlibacter sp. TaxID=1917967 RepID=UPI002C67078B|nr:thiamine pyrophosphate-requiring protein [Ramlibacter sp.]HVZ43900.1 thiamine pyrophosphate-requiring protein [Ramlibacter sp.]
MATTTVADQVLARLHAWGVHRVFGYPGDGINAFLGAFDRMQERIEFVQARHEELAAFMACAHAKFTGEVGVCVATSGPGAIHLLNGLYDAKADHQPVVAIVGQSARSAIGGDYQQEVDLHNLFKDVAHEYVHTAMDPAQVRHLVDRAVRIARMQRTVTCLIFPHDLQELPAVETPPRAHDTVHSGIGRSAFAMVPPQGDLQAAADLLNGASRVAILAGAGALHASRELRDTAELLGAGIAKALLGKAAVPDDVPYVTGSIGLLGTYPSWYMMNECDALLMVGTSFPYSEYLPPEGKARAVQIDVDGRLLGLRYPTDINLVGDSRATLEALKPLLARKTDRAWQEDLQGKIAEWWQVLQARAMNEANPINPQRFFRELSPRLPERCIVACDSGTSAAWYARDLKFREGMMGSVSGGLASMGCAVPYALAAKLAHPERAVVALAGDGAMQMNGINGLITVAERWRDWSDPRLVVVVLNNGDLNMVTFEQRALGGERRFDASQLLPRFPYADYAVSLGLGGIRIDEPGGIVSAIDEAFAAKRPTLLEVVCDPDVPAVPPHVTAKQARSYFKALMHGDPEARDVMVATAKEWWAAHGGKKKAAR